MLEALDSFILLPHYIYHYGYYNLSLELLRYSANLCPFVIIRRDMRLLGTSHICIISWCVFFTLLELITKPLIYFKLLMWKND